MITRPARLKTYLRYLLEVLEIASWTQKHAGTKQMASIPVYSCNYITCRTPLRYAQITITSCYRCWCNTDNSPTVPVTMWLSQKRFTYNNVRQKMLKHAKTSLRPSTRADSFHGQYWDKQAVYSNIKLARRSSLHLRRSVMVTGVTRNHVLRVVPSTQGFFPLRRNQEIWRFKCYAMLTGKELSVGTKVQSVARISVLSCKASRQADTHPPAG